VGFLFLWSRQCASRSLLDVAVFPLLSIMLKALAETVMLILHKVVVVEFDDMELSLPFVWD
jgi:hypothetical protein